MGKRLPKEELLAEIQLERTALMDTLAALTRRDFTAGELNDAGWSVKDVLTHVLDWEDRGLQWYRDGLDGKPVVLPAPGFTWRDIRALNDKIYRRHRRKSVGTVLQELDTVHQRTLAVLAEVSDEALTTLNYFDWTGKSWTLSDYLRANTASHYRWARKKIRRWMRQREPN